MTHATTTVRVRWSDCDPAGIVFYPRFFEWYDLGTEALFEALGWPWPVMFPHFELAGVPILESGSRFVAPVRYGDSVAMASRVAWVREKTFRMEHAISVGSTPCAEGFEVRAWVKRAAGPDGRIHAAPIPDEIASKLRGA